MTPEGIALLAKRGHVVLVEGNAGRGSGSSDEAYEKAGARIAKSSHDVWDRAELIMKVKEPTEAEFALMRPGQILLTFLHLAANRELTLALLEREVLGIAYETIQLEDGTLPILKPMSEIAGKLAVQIGAHCLEASQGGRGILLGGAEKVPPARAVILGGGSSGQAACHLALGMGATVSVLDIDPEKVRKLDDLFQAKARSLLAEEATVDREVAAADLVVGAILVPGASAPKVITRALLRKMTPGSVIVDIAVDQGGCAETTRPTTHDNPTYSEEGIVHCCISNLPSAVPLTATLALTALSLPYALEIADKGWEKAAQENPALKKGVNTIGGTLTCPPVGKSLGIAYREI